MGGGAGITFTFHLDCGEVRFSRKRGLFVPVGRPPSVEKFDARGYQDGMRDVDGSMLRVTGLEFEKLHPDDAAYFAERVHWRDRLSWNCHGPAEEMVFAGYIRGTWKNTLPMHISSEADVDGYGIFAGVSFTVEVADRRRFQRWYESTFDFIPDNEWDAEDSEHARRAEFGIA